MKFFLKFFPLLFIPSLALSDYSFNNASLAYSIIDDNSLDVALDAKGIAFDFSKALNRQSFIKVTARGVGLEESRRTGVFVDAFEESISVSFGKYARNENGTIMIYAGLMTDQFELTVESEKFSDNDTGLLLGGGAVIPIQEYFEILADYQVSNLYSSSSATASLGISKNLNHKIALHGFFTKTDDRDSKSLAIRVDY